jgi:hypothetical protein
LAVRNEKELAKTVAQWPANRLVELWNSFAGVAPFTDCKPVKKFQARDKAVARIWAVIQRLGNAIEPKLVENPKPREEATPAAQTKEGRQDQGGEECETSTENQGHEEQEGPRWQAARGTHRAQVIATIQRKGGATLDQIMEATGWQRHTIRGFISILGSKGGIKVTSTRRESDGARVYEA